jgi:hypothetical protein
MPNEKLTVSWDDVNSPDVDAKLKEQDAKSRADAFTSPALSMNAAALKSQQRSSIWYNTVFTMAFFGVLGGLLAWGAGELIQLNPLTQSQYLAQLSDAQDKWEAYKGVENRAAAGIDVKTANLQKMLIREAAEADGGNPYFRILIDPALSTPQKEQKVAQQHANYDTKAFIANVLAYGLIGMLIALCLAVAEPLVDRNVHGALINGAVGAMLGLFGGVIVSLFVDRLHAALLGGADGAAAVGKQVAGASATRQVLADAIKYGVIGSFLLIAPGVLMRNGKKLVVGLAGGFAGGVIGGLLFAPVAGLTGNPVLSRAIAIVAIGGIAGVATGLIENAAKSGWLKVIAGFIAGKQFILYRGTTYIGSSPDCHIYLFKDPAIGRRHAAVHIVPGGFDLEDLPLGAPTFVNGKPITRTRLRTGDQIQVGQTAFTFQEKVKPV